MERKYTAYELFQLDRYGNIIPDCKDTPDEDLFESGIEELNRLSEWIELQNEMSTHTHEI